MKTLKLACAFALVLGGCQDGDRTPLGGPSATAVSEAAEAANEPETKSAGSGRLAEGDPAPELTLELHDGSSLDVRAASEEHKLLVYFYPKDDTPGCTVEAKGLRDVYGDLESAGLKVVGVSTQDAKSHQAFVESYDLPFPLAVNGEAAAQAFGVPLRSGMAARQSFLLEKGKVTKVWRDVKPAAHAEQVLEAARS